MNYGLSGATAEKLETTALTPEQRARLADMIWIVDWAAGTCPSGGAYGLRAIAPAQLPKTFRFKTRENSEDLDGALADLARLGITSDPQLQESTGGRPKSLIFLWDVFTPDGSLFDSAGIEKVIGTRYLRDMCPDTQHIACHCQTLLGPGDRLAPEKIRAMVEAAQPPAVIPDAPAAVPFPAAPGQARPLLGHEVRALFDFRMMSFGQCLFFRKGQVIDDIIVSRQALADGMPVVLVGQEDNKQYCPKCHRAFEPKEPSVNEPVCLRPLADLMFTYNNQLLRFGPKDVISHNPPLIAWLLGQPSLPTERIVPGVNFKLCACGHTYDLQPKPIS